MIRLKRAYERPTASDGYRVLVERLWPRGVTKRAARLDAWLKDVAPSPELRSWYSHDVARWSEFRRRYARELRARPELLGELRARAAHGPVTLVYATRDERHSSARVLKELLERRSARSRSRARPGARRARARSRG